MRSGDCLVGDMRARLVGMPAGPRVGTRTLVHERGRLKLCWMRLDCTQADQTDRH